MPVFSNHQGEIKFLGYGLDNFWVRFFLTFILWQMLKQSIFLSSCNVGSSLINSLFPCGSTGYQVFAVASTLFFIFAIVFISSLIFKSYKDELFNKNGLFRSIIYSLIYILPLLFLIRGFEGFDYRIIFSEKMFFWIIFLLVSAFWEELLFRGLIFQVWSKYNGFIIGFLISFFIFGLSHIILPNSANGNLVNNPNLTRIALVFSTSIILSPVFSLIVYRTKNIIGTTIAHFLFNFMGIVSLFAGVSSNTSPTILGFTYVLIFLYPVLIEKIDRKFFPVYAVSKIKWVRYFFALFALIIILLLINFAEMVGFFK